MAEQTIAELLQDLETSRERGIEAIIGRGGTIGTTAGFADFPSAIYNIPADNAITTVYFNDEAQQITVRPNATNYAYLAEFGGITRRGEVGPEDDMQYYLYDTAFDGAVVFNAEGEEASEIVVPPEILALEGYGEGININYYNKVDLVNKKYKRCIVTKTFDGSEGVGSSIKPTGWRLTGTGNSAYFFIKIGEYGEYAINNAIVCDRYNTVMVKDTTNIGVGINNSTASVGVCVLLRPDGVQNMTISNDLVTYLQSNPITVKVALMVPIEYDLPVDMNPLVKVAAGGVVKLNTTEVGSAPIKMIFQTLRSKEEV